MGLPCYFSSYHFWFLVFFFKKKNQTNKQKPGILQSVASFFSVGSVPHLTLSYIAFSLLFRNPGPLAHDTWSPSFPLRVVDAAIRPLLSAEATGWMHHSEASVLTLIPQCTPTISPGNLAYACPFFWRYSYFCLLFGLKKRTSNSSTQERGTKRGGDSGKGLYSVSDPV